MEIAGEKRIGNFGEEKNKRKRTLCPHEKRKDNCAVCNGCSHGKIKYRCKICKGCLHGKIKYRCKICKGCLHGKIKECCVKCSGCLHGKFKHCCIKCSGCLHGKRKDYCKICKSCLHGKIKQCCLKCIGCSHGKIRRKCIDCMLESFDLQKIITKRVLCIACLAKKITCERKRRGIQVCAACDSNSLPRIELHVRSLLLDVVTFEPSMADNMILGGTECNTERKRPDLAWLYSDRAIFVEIDERGGHPDRTSSCEMAKMCQQAQSIFEILKRPIPVFYFRLNPDECDNKKVSLKERIRVLGQDINDTITRDVSELDPNPIYVGYYYYHSKCYFHMEEVQKRPEVFNIFKK